MPHVDIPGYAYGADSLERAPISEEEFSYLRRTVCFTHDDKEYLEEVAEVLDGKIDEVVDTWYTFVADNDFLLAYFSTPDGKPHEEYLERVRPRFARWIEDVCLRKYDQKWLDYQHEIGKRHTHIKKGEADGADVEPHIPLRYLIGFVYPAISTVHDYLMQSDHDPRHVERMCDAWTKAVLMQVALWTAPYAKEGWF